MQVTTIWIDCDDVLSETIDQVLKNPLLQKKWITRENVLSYELWENDQFWLTLQEAIELFYDVFTSSKFFDIQPVAGAKEKLQQRKAEGKKLIVVTARATQIKERTIEWINQHFPDLFDDYVFANIHMENEVPKSELCKQAGIQIMIEDNLDFSRELSQNGIPCFLLDKPRNSEYTPEQYPGITKVSSWDDIDLSPIP